MNGDAPNPPSTLNGETPLRPSLPKRKDYVGREAGHWLLAVVIGLCFLVVFALLGITYVLRHAS